MFGFLFNSLFTAKDKARFLFASVGMIFNGLIEVVSIAMLIPFLNVAANPQMIYEKQYLRIVYSALHFGSSRDFLFCLGLILILTIFLANLSNVFFTWFSLRFTWAINHSLSVRLAKHYMGLNYVNFIQRNSADLQKNIQVEVMEVSYNVIKSILACLNKGISLLLTFVFLAIINPILTFSLIIIFALVYFCIYFFVKKELSYIGMHSVRDNEAKFRSIGEALGVFKLAKLLHLEDYFIAQFSAASERFCRNQCKRTSLAELPPFAVETLAFSVIMGICLYLIGSKQNFSDGIAMVGLFTFAAYRLLPRIQQFYTYISILRSCWPHVIYLQQELEYGLNCGMGDLRSCDEKSNFAEAKDASLVEFQEVSFSYPNTKGIIIDKISFSISENLTVGFLGETGSGKTTILDLILGILRPDSGTIFIHQKPLDAANMTAWQKSIGYVPQDIYLIDSSIAENVAFGVPREKIDFNQVRDACALANIAEFIENDLIAKYDTVVGERGVRISGGQRQRIGIARALYYKPKLLVFDEATSALDNETEKSVMEAIENLSHKKTVIVVAHRLTTLRKCDLIFKIHKGRIVKSGCFSEVVEDGCQHLPQQTKQ
jgi:ATP-binding cassette subfamily C protein